jgi:hypothetical protein
MKSSLQDSSWSRWLERWVAPVFLFLLAFIPRAVYPVSRAMLWYYRAIHFGDAVLAGDWAATYQSYHPGVTTMWLVGAALKLFGWWRGLSSDELLGAYPTVPGTINEGVAAGVVALALALALCIVLAYVLLRRIAGQKVAFVGGFLLALDPFHLMSSKVLHVDAMLATLMFSSALFLLNYVRQRRLGDLALSGLFAGLAFLTKSPSLMLVPYAVLVVGLDGLTSRGVDSREALGARLWVVVRALLVWGSVAMVVFVALWPAIWVDPLGALDNMRERVTFHVETAHFNPAFFNGRITLEDPGPLYYLATIAWKTTLVTLPMIAVALVLAVLRFRRSEASKTVGWLVVYVAGFTLQMGLSARKELRYLLPAFPALGIIAAFGLVQTADALARVRRWLPTVLIVLALTLQALLVLPHHPYYGTHHNKLLGGSRVARNVLPFQDQGEGLDLAARYLNGLPRVQHSRALIHPLGGRIFERYFEGFTVTLPDPWISYRVYYLNQVMRRVDSEAWEAAWQADQQSEPLWTVDFDGVTYVWVYGAPPGELAPGGTERAVDYRLGDHIALTRVRLSAETAAPGDVLTVVLYWESDGAVEGNYTVFCHLLSEGGELGAQQDNPPVYGVRPTPGWRPGELIDDSYDLVLPEDLAPGEYVLSVGMYAPDTADMSRVPAYDADGARLLDDRIILATIRVEAP